MEVSFDSGNDEESAPKNGRQRLNDFLALLMLGGRADLEPTLNKTGITLPGNQCLDKSVEINSAISNHGRKEIPLGKTSREGVGFAGGCLSPI
jgi:hypothetical protein